MSRTVLVRSVNIAAVKELRNRDVLYLKFTATYSLSYISELTVDNATILFVPLCHINVFASFINIPDSVTFYFCIYVVHCTVRSESRCALRLRYV
jgi:hypothetical protein